MPVHVGADESARCWCLGAALLDVRSPLARSVASKISVFFYCSSWNIVSRAGQPLLSIAIALGSSHHRRLGSPFPRYMSPQGRIVYREWAPGAVEAQLIGDFNGWEGQPMERDDFGTWSIRWGGAGRSID